MSIRRRFFCDGPNCGEDMPGAAGPLNVETHGEHPPTFITVHEEPGFPHEDRTELHFCSWDCVLKYAAKHEPTEIVPLGDGPEGGVK